MYADCGDIFDEKQYVVLGRGCLSFLALHSITGNRWGMHHGIDSFSLHCLN